MTVNQCATCVHDPRHHGRPIRHVLDLCTYVGFQDKQSTEGQAFWAAGPGEPCPGYQRARKQRKEKPAA